MSSEPMPGMPGLCNLDYLPRYERRLRQHLPPGFAAFGGFFARLDRISLLGRMLQENCPRPAGRILNIGCGPFASEIFLSALQGAHVTAVDYTPEFAPFLELFRRDGHLSRLDFRQGDVMALNFAPRAYDLVILHDILYEPALDMQALLAHLDTALKPGGLLFLDFVNSQTRWLWKALGRGDRFRRYHPDEVRRIMARAGYEIIDWRPASASASPAGRALHGVLQGLLRISNRYALMARKADAPDG